MIKQGDIVFVNEIPGVWKGSSVVRLSVKIIGCFSDNNRFKAKILDNDRFHNMIFGFYYKNIIPISRNIAMDIE